MDRFFMRILLATVIVTAGAGCVNEEHERHDAVVALAFDPVMQVHVRSSAAPDETVSPGVCVWSLAGGRTWLADRAAAEVYLPPARLVRNGHFWQPETSVDWPSAETTLTCIGFAPFEAVTACDAERGVVFDGVDVTTDPGDLRYTEPQADRVKLHNGGVVNLPLLPALCQVEFRVRSKGETETTFFVRRIVLDAINCRGSFQSLPSPAWELSGDPGALPLFEGEFQLTDVPQSIVAARRVIPQPLHSTLTVDYEYLTPTGSRIQQSETVGPLEKMLYPGYSYTFTLAVGHDGVEVLPENPAQNSESQKVS